ncbi:helix-hairpin-helix domain-containing protein, partial [bacterium]|nr:helix-hairpin-helix domain-containing protein [bacterium]
RGARHIKRDDPGHYPLNTITASELMRHLELDKAEAKAIIQYRREHRLIHRYDELSTIKGLKPGTIQLLKDRTIL